MEKIKRRRTTAWIITVVIVFLSSGFGVAKTAALMRRETESYFSGSNSITEDLNTKIGYTHNIITISKRYMEEEDVKALRQSISQLEAAKTPSSKYKANLQLNAEVSQLRKRLESLGDAVEDTDTLYLDKTIRNIDSIDVIISKSGYNSSARDYNAAINSFPASLFKNILGLRNLELYGE